MEKNDYNARQIELMKKQILYYQEGSLSINMLISRLESLCNCLQGITPEEKDNFSAAWGEIEDIYAISLFRQRDFFTPEEQEHVDYFLKELLDIIEAL